MLIKVTLFHISITVKISRPCFEWRYSSSHFVCLQGFHVSTVDESYDDWEACSSMIFTPSFN